MDDMYSVIYGVVMGEESGSTVYYNTVGEAAEYAYRCGLPIVKVTTELVECLCYSTPEPYCPIHGY